MDFMNRGSLGDFFDFRNVRSMMARRWIIKRMAGVGFEVALVGEVFGRSLKAMVVFIFKGLWLAAWGFLPKAVLEPKFSIWKALPAPDFSQLFINDENVASTFDKHNRTGYVLLKISIILLYYIP